jgi:hypothetical protein
MMSDLKWFALMLYNMSDYIKRPRARIKNIARAFSMVIDSTYAQEFQTPLEIKHPQN